MVGPAALERLVESEVKGVWFVTARSYVQGRSEALLERVLERVPAEHRHALSEPLPSRWYPEASLQASLHALHSELAGGDPTRFVRVIEECTEIGISRFFRVMLRLTSPAFVLRQVPAMWSHIRRGAGRVTVDAGGPSTTLRYRDFPWFRDPRYSDLTLGSLRALVRTCTRAVPRVEIEGRGEDWLDVRILHGAPPRP